MLLHLDEDAGRCTEFKALCMCARDLCISAQPQSLFHSRGCSALPMTVALEVQPSCAGKVLDTVICVVELGQEWQWGSCI